MQFELAAAELHFKVAERAKEQRAKELFSWLAEQDRQHAQTFIGKFQVLPYGFEHPREIPLLRVIREAIEQMERKGLTFRRMLGLAIETEERVAQFYHDLATHLGLEDEINAFLGEADPQVIKTSSMASELAQTEEDHARRIKEFGGSLKV